MPVAFVMIVIMLVTPVVMQMSRLDVEWWEATLWTLAMWAFIGWLGWGIMHLLSLAIT